MFGAIDAGILIRYGTSIGVYYQLHLDLDCPPWIFVNPEHLTEVSRNLSYTDSRGMYNGVNGHVNHPTFEMTRNWLESNGYIKTERSWSGGDRVLKPLFFNNVYKDIGEKFYCAAAMAHHHSDAYNDGNPLPTPNYTPPDDIEWELS